MRFLRTSRRKLAVALTVVAASVGGVAASLPHSTGAGAMLQYCGEDGSECDGGYYAPPPPPPTYNSCKCTGGGNRRG
jgi:hypothetical protein